MGLKHLSALLLAGLCAFPAHAQEEDALQYVDQLIGSSNGGAFRNIRAWNMC